ncbi:MAG: hypothetical protein Q8K30_07150 [Candidatus Gracilibacteria bacterium]|nr:hypothetical protein [Candidatus Gracilibacteria bacterium]MDP2396554.1 hypothetical protein [bacterium]MDP3381148.1 hypothetical protein [bacterium]
MKASIKHEDNCFVAIEENYALNLLSQKLEYKKILPIIKDVLADMDQINELKSTFCFASHDVVNISIHDKNFSRIHTHPDKEARWTISGIGYFFVPIGSILLKLEVEVGDFIVINSGIKHWYEFPDIEDNIHVVIRFFETDDGRTTNYLD